MSHQLRAASPWVLAAVLLAAGANHFLNPGAYDGLIPGWLGPPRFWVLSSGVAEIACGLLLAHPRTRAPAASAAGRRSCCSW